MKPFGILLPVVLFFLVACAMDTVQPINFCRVRRTLRVTPAMEAGITDRVWELEELVA